MAEKRSREFWLLAVFFALFVLFMYGPMLVIVVLSFQGPEGGLTFPMRGWSLHWFYKLAEGLGVVDISAALKRSLGLDRKSTRLNSSHERLSRMPSSA